MSKFAFLFITPKSENFLLKTHKLWKKTFYSDISQVKLTPYS